MLHSVLLLHSDDNLVRVYDITDSTLTTSDFLPSHILPVELYVAIYLTFSRLFVPLKQDIRQVLSHGELDEQWPVFPVSGVVELTAQVRVHSVTCVAAVADSLPLVHGAAGIEK